MPAPLIYINGFPGVGKLTIARTLQTLIPNSKVIDNHSLIDPVEKVCRRGSALYHDKRGESRRSVLEPIKTDQSTHSTIYIFTDSQTEHNECMGDYTDLACGENARRFYSVVLDCEWEENVKRLTMAGRGGNLNGKLTDPEILRRYREHGDGIWKFEDDDEIVLDVTNFGPMDAALEIWEWWKQREMVPMELPDI